MNTRPRVLVVDDRQGTVSSALRSALAECEVEIAKDPVEVIYRVDCAPGFDLIFCDLARGDLPGPELWAYLSLTRKEAAKRIVFVASGPLRAQTRAFLFGVPNACIDARSDRASGMTQLSSHRCAPTFGARSWQQRNPC